MIVLYLTDIPWPVSAVILGMILLNITFFWLSFPSSWREIRLNQSDVSIIAHNGSILVGLLANTSMVLPCFVILAVKLEGRYLTRYRFIFRDALQPEIFRQLCVCLKFSK
jgi:hypothetical protein